ncbi:MAG: SCO family protein [Rhodobacterales bacterium]|nr:SCO family protein [Rhodobacterales bacterium]MDX5391161.1 SCO family protein [Rhodobacterales bacterium]MDX5490854.1 SCO family protein [Rhodobacterales bacterium]
MSRIYAIAAVCLVIAMTAGVFVYTRLAGTPDKFAQCRTTNIAGGASQIGGPFTLVDETGQTVTDADVIDQPSLIYFGYTFCPDVCPLDTSRNAEAIDILEERGLMVKPVFISIDPERDTPEVVDAFTANLHERMLGLTGSPEQVRAASRAYRTFYQKQESDDEYYLVDHSTMSYLVFPEDGFVEVFQRSLRAEDVADRIQCFLEAR